jgi:hypothetical protein
MVDGGVLVRDLQAGLAARDLVSGGSGSGSAPT